MITRGTLIGEILDELALIREKVEIRTGCQIYDLPVFAENFCRDILQHLLGCKFKNLNSERSNNPGIDLGALNGQFAIQITATSSSLKVNKTLEAITDSQRKKYKRIIVLILGKKQASYSIKDASSNKHPKFDPKTDVWDLRDIAKMAFDLEVEKLNLLHKEIRNQTLKLQVDLEVKKRGGRFKTNGYGLWESMPTPKIGSCDNFIAYIESNHAALTEDDRKLIRRELKSLATRLSRLPRITREFFVSLIERRDPNGTKRFQKLYGWESALYSSVERQYKGPDLQGELDLLDHEGFIDIRHQVPEDYDDGPSAIGFKFTSKSEDLNFHLIEYIQARGSCLRVAIGDIDLSIF